MSDKKETPKNNYPSFFPTYPFKARIPSATHLAMFTENTPIDEAIRYMGGSIRLQPLGKEELEIIDRTVGSRKMSDVKYFLIKKCGYNIQNVVDLGWDDIISTLKGCLKTVSGNKTDEASAQILVENTAGGQNIGSQDKHEDIIELKPNICGIGLNINALIRKKGKNVWSFLKSIRQRLWRS